MQKIRSLVSKKKIRFQEDGFDLDLTYITPRIIALGFPSSGTEAIYRNPADQVKKFFDKYHDKHYQIYNLCSERDYDPSKFDGRVKKFPFDDHNPPPFDLMLEFVKDANEFLLKDERNVIGVHCKAGKGRTGTMISALLLYTKTCKTAEEALALFGDIRTKDGKGVTIPSQRRYVKYFENALLHGFPTTRTTATLLSIIMFTSPNFDIGGGCDPYFLIYQNGKLYFDSRKKYKIRKMKKEQQIEFPDLNLDVCGDIKVVFYDQDDFSKDDKMFWFWFNTNFFETTAPLLSLTKNEIDGAVKDKSHKQFDPDFGVALIAKLDSLPKREKVDNSIVANVGSIV